MAELLRGIQVLKTFTCNHDRHTVISIAVSVLYESSVSCCSTLWQSRRAGPRTEFEVDFRCEHCGLGVSSELRSLAKGLASEGDKNPSIWFLTNIGRQEIQPEDL